MNIIRLYDAKTHFMEQQPAFQCWSWLDGLMEVFHNDYKGDGISHPKGERTLVFINHHQIFELDGRLEPQEIWGLLSP